MPRMPWVKCARSMLGLTRPPASTSSAGKDNEAFRARAVIGMSGSCGRPVPVGTSAGMRCPVGAPRSGCCPGPARAAGSGCRRPSGARRRGGRAEIRTPCRLLVMEHGDRLAPRRSAWGARIGPGLDGQRCGQGRGTLNVHQDGSAATEMLVAGRRRSAGPVSEVEAALEQAVESVATADGPRLRFPGAAFGRRCGASVTVIHRARQSC